MDVCQRRCHTGSVRPRGARPQTRRPPPTSMPARDERARRTAQAGTRGSTPSSSRAPAAAAPPGRVAAANPQPQQQHRAQCAPDAALQESLGDERAADEGERRPDELHDFDLVAPRVQAEPDDRGHGHRGGQRHQRARARSRRARMRVEPAAHRAPATRGRSARRRRRAASRPRCTSASARPSALGVRPHAHFERRGKRIVVDVVGQSTPARRTAVGTAPAPASFETYSRPAADAALIDEPPR